MDADATLADHWTSLVRVAVLGTDRRLVPAAPAGPLAELVCLDEPSDPPGDLARQVALLTAARRGGLRPLPAVAGPRPCPADPRPLCPPAAVRRLDEILASWPIVEAEWLARVLAAGFRLPGDVTALLLSRHREDPIRRSAVVDVAGPLADWLVDLFPELGPGRRAKPSSSAPAPLPEHLAALVRSPSHEAVSSLVDGLASGRLVARHRAALVQVVAALDPTALPGLADQLEVLAVPPGVGGLAHELADLARLRCCLVDDLRPPDSGAA